MKPVGRDACLEDQPVALARARSALRLLGRAPGISDRRLETVRFRPWVIPGRLSTSPAEATGGSAAVGPAGASAIAAARRDFCRPGRLSSHRRTAAREANLKLIMSELPRVGLLRGMIGSPTRSFHAGGLDRHGHDHRCRPVRALDQLDALDRVFSLGLDAGNSGSAACRA